MSTSGTLSFQSAQNEQIIREAFERVGISLLEIDQEKVVSAQRSLNLILTSLPNRQLNLWTVSREMMGLNPNQATYTLPDATSDVLEVLIRYSTRNLSGIPGSDPGGNAANAFDGNPATACTQTGINGNISYQWNSSTSICLVGVQSNVTRNYTLTFEYSNDGGVWASVLQTSNQSYPQGNIIWFEVPVPVSATYFRARETDGSILDIQELYFNNSVNDVSISRNSRSENMSIPNKTQNPGKPSSYIVWRDLSPTITLYPAPDVNYNCMFYSRIVMPQDIGSLMNTPPVPSRFFESIVCGLSVKLALKTKNYDLYDRLVLAYEKELKYALNEDSERVPLRIGGNFSYGYTQR